MKKTQNVRELALELLLKIEKNQSFSHLLINDALKNKKIEALDRNLLTELVYGTLQRRLTLDYYLTPFLKKQPEDWVLELLRLSVYQLVYLDKVPEHAILNEAGEIAKKRGHQGVTKFVNGVLRNLIRHGIPKISAIKDEVKRVSVETSLPLWLAKRWADQFGLVTLREIGLAFLTPPHQTVRVNKLEATRDQVAREWNQINIETTPSPYLDEALIVKRGTVAQTKQFQKGIVSIQDESSMLPAYALQLEDDLTVLDACSAPGGKTTHIAEKMNGTGVVYALDIHEKKTKLVQQAAERLGLLNIRTKAYDARKASELFEKEMFDRILVDAPCSGFGVLRRKPDIKYSKTATDIQKLATIQLEILEEVSQLLKENGILVYSTCTIDKAENATVLKTFLEKHPEFQLERVQVPKRVAALFTGDYLELLPTAIGSDGFFVSSIRKKSSAQRGETDAS